MRTDPATIEAILDILLEEESLLHSLIEQAGREREVLIDSDFAGLEEVTRAMLQTAAGLEKHERRREQLLAVLGLEDATLSDLTGHAEAHGIDGFSDARDRLLARAEALRDAQEQNASLLLSAATLRERWFRLLTGLAAPTYGARGEQRSHDQRFISRSA
jgi:hypothetical protein